MEAPYVAEGHQCFLDRISPGLADLKANKTGITSLDGVQGLPTGTVILLMRTVSTPAGRGGREATAVLLYAVIHYTLRLRR